MRKTKKHHLLDMSRWCYIYTDGTVELRPSEVTPLYSQKFPGRDWL